MTDLRSARPCGSWPTPINAASIASDSVSYGQLAVDGEDLYWLESRPAEAGRCVLVRRDVNGQCEDVTPEDFSVRSRVHEYGGGAYAVHQGHIYFCNAEDQAIYEQQPGQCPRALTPSGPKSDYRFSDIQVDCTHRRLICVREQHFDDHREPENCLVSISLQDRTPTAGEILAQGADFYASPTLDSNSTHLAWIEWDHPDMPWDATRLMLAHILPSGELESTQHIAGDVQESIFQPQWGPDHNLYFVSDRSNWWNLYRWDREEDTALLPRSAEFGLPQWVFGMSTYAFSGEHQITCLFSENGFWKCGHLDTESTRFEEISLPFSDLQGIRSSAHHTILIAASASQPPCLLRLTHDQKKSEVIAHSQQLDIDPAYLSAPQSIDFPSANGRVAHALFYPPANPDFVAGDGEAPPLIVRTHGGPTAATSSALNLANQFWTSRGFALLDINYAGSTGYGRKYREALNGEWGIADVQDCEHGVHTVCKRGWADPARVAIRGSSAGGYTTLAALTFTNTFSVGTSLYGISDLEALASDTHKFEARYLDRLVGPYPKMKDIYIERSPIQHTDRLSSPMILFQGLEDKVVPPNQAETMVKAVARRGLPVAYITFPNEAHGFRKADTIRQALEAELYFYGQIFGFEPADQLEPIKIQNLQTV